MSGSVALILSGCASQENKIADYLKKNPKVIFDVIEENPEQFIEVVNAAAKKSQATQYQKRDELMKKDQLAQVKNPLRPALSKESLLFGRADAPIVIVEYADFQCPACGMAYRSLMQIKNKYSGKVQFHYKQMPLDFHKMAMPAIKAEAPEKAAKFYKEVFEKQANLKNEDYLKSVASRLGLNMKSLQKRLELKSTDESIAADIKEFQQFGFDGTPSLIVNGVALNGAQPAEEIEKVIQLTMAAK